ncbi:hypothetical protein Tco_0683557 [Tanacetum coccineum]
MERTASQTTGFANYIGDKEEFIPTVKKEWNADIEGHNIVIEAKDKLKLAQTKLDTDPHNQEIKRNKADCLQEYYDARTKLHPDGYSFVFFKKAWSIVGEDVCKAVKEVFTSRKLLGEMNATLITLVPKLKHPLKVSDYKPIACCNVVYKCINKIITNILKSSLQKLVSLTASR